MFRSISLLLFSLVYVLSFQGTLQASQPPVGEPSIALLTPNPALGDVVLFAVVVPKHAAKLTISVVVVCMTIEEHARTFTSEAKPWDSGILLGGTASDWLLEFPTEPMDCWAAAFYVRRSGPVYFATMWFVADGLP